MKNRIPRYPGRIKLTPVSGQANVYDMVRMDDPIEVGDPLVKETLLKDATAAIFGLPSTAVPNDVFAKIPTLIDTKVNTWTKLGTYVLGGSSRPEVSLRVPSGTKRMIVASTGITGTFYNPTVGIYFGDKYATVGSAHEGNARVNSFTAVFEEVCSGIFSTFIETSSYVENITTHKFVDKISLSSASKMEAVNTGSNFNITLEVYIK